MIYRIDYLVSLILVGAILGVLVGRHTSKVAASRVAKWYFVGVVLLLAIRSVAFVCSAVLTNVNVWQTIIAAVGDAANLLTGFLVGAALRRPDRRHLLCDSAVLAALCLYSSLSFIISGLGKAFYVDATTHFFTQSGYSVAFLKFIMTVEVLGATGLLISWTLLPAIAGLSVDMFGAIYTHLHNGDPINDSTGAVGQLIRFGIIVSLLAWKPGANDLAGTVRHRFATAAITGAMCAVAAAIGGTLMRH